MMTTHFFANAAARLSAGALCFIALMGAKADAGAKDFEFQPVAAEVKNGANSEIAVRLINKTTGKPVENAVIFRTRLDMSPENMGDMIAKTTASPSSQPGEYRYKADFTMAGGWAFKLQAKVPGESETIEGSVLFKAK